MTNAESRIQSAKSRIQTLKLKKATAEGTMKEVLSQQQTLKEEYQKNGVTPQTLDQELTRSQTELEQKLEATEQQLTKLESELQV